MKKSGAATGITLAIFSLFVSLGVSSTLFGLVMPQATGALGISLAYAGLVTTLFALGRTAGSFFSGLATDRWGERSVTYVGVVVKIVGIALLALAESVPVFFAGGFLMGIGFGTLDVTLNVSITVLYPERRAAMLSLLHAFYGVGSFAGPLALGLIMARQSSWRSAPWSVVLLLVAMGALYAVWVKQGEVSAADPSAAPQPQPHASGDGSFRSMLRHRPFLLMLPVGFIYQGVSWSLSLWLPTFMTEVHGASALQAASAVSALFLGLTLGRFANSVITQRLGDANTLLAGSAGALVALSTALLAPTALLTLLALGATGFSLASLIPTSLAVLTRLMPQAAGRASGTFMTLSATGVLLFPWFLGLLSERWGMRAGLGAGIVALCILLMVVISLRRLLGRLTPNITAM